MRVPLICCRRDWPFAAYSFRDFPGSMDGRTGQYRRVRARLSPDYLPVVAFFPWHGRWARPFRQLDAVGTASLQ
jgi:hypothetical protein